MTKFPIGKLTANLKVACLLKADKSSLIQRNFNRRFVSVKASKKLSVKRTTRILYPGTRKNARGSLSVKRSLPCRLIRKVMSLALKYHFYRNNHRLRSIYYCIAPLSPYLSVDDGRIFTALRMHAMRTSGKYLPETEVSTRFLNVYKQFRSLVEATVKDNESSKDEPPIGVSE